MVFYFDMILLDICDLEIALREKKDVKEIIIQGNELKEKLRNLLIPDVIKDSIFYLYSSVIDFYRINNERILENQVGYYALLDLIRTKFFAIRNYIIDIETNNALSDEDRLQKRLLLDTYVNPENISNIDISRVYDYFSLQACSIFFKRYNEKMGISRKKQ